MAQFLIRRAITSDAAALTRLTSQLGYPASEAAIQRRLQRIVESPGDCLLVAEAPGGELAGWIHGFLSQLLESDYRVEIGGLLVDAPWRRQGIGRRLVQALDDWAVDRGAFELSVRCREERLESHRFYERLRFRYAKTQRVYRQRAGRMAQPGPSSESSPNPPSLA